MAEAAVVEATPAAPEASPAPPAPQKTVAVSQMPEPKAPIAPPKPGSARERLFQDLRKKAGIETPPSPAPVEATIEEGDQPAGPAEPAASVAATTPEAKKKQSPWKLVDEWKDRASKAEARIAELSKDRPSPELVAKEAERVKALEARAKTLEDEIRYVNFSKSKEFQEKYQAPYEAAWKRAMDDLGEIQITDENSGEARSVSPKDILALVNMRLDQARSVANQAFGDFADDVMAHRKEIRRLFDDQAKALEEAKTNGAQWEESRKQAYQKAITDTQAFIKDQWEIAKKQAIEDKNYGKYFLPVEGDQEGNQRLAKGYELVDRAYSENPMDPKLTPEQRASVVRRHAAVRHRAAAFGRMLANEKRNLARIAELETRLKQYEASEPTTGNPNGSALPASSPATARDSVFGALRKLAH